MSTRVSSHTPELLAVLSTLLCLGIIMVFSSSWVGLDGNGRDPTFFFRRQLTWIILSAIGLVLAWSTDYRLLARWAAPALLLGLALLGAAFLPGVGQPIRNVHRWVRLGGLQIQPSEMVKLILPLCLAAFLARAHEVDLKRHTLPSLVAIGVTCGLIAIAPDFGTALFVGGTSAVLLFVAGAPLRHLAGLSLPPVLLGSLAMVSRFAHIKRRLVAFLEPEQHLSGAGYQVYQSLIALGSGGVSGRGLGAGHQKFLYLPDAHTDFIFAVLGEELGFLGTSLVVVLFLSLLYCGVRIVRNTTDRLGFLMAFSVIFSLCLQAAINMAVVTASVPTKGISMPLVSFGGSSLFFTMVGVGILLNIATVSARERRRMLRGSRPTRRSVSGQSSLSE